MYVYIHIQTKLETFNVYISFHDFTQIFFYSRSLYINLIGLLFVLVCSVFAGLCLYSVYKSCDPWTAGLVSAPDQV